MIRRLRFVVLLVASCAALSACVQYPTAKQQVVDQRPQLSFVVDEGNAEITAARVLVDGLDVGPVGNFVQGKAALRVLPGTHLIRVQTSSTVLLEQRIYLGDGVAQALIVK